MRPKLAIVVLLSALSLSGCLVRSLFPLYNTADLVFEPDLIGIWQQTPDEKGRWEFSKSGEREYHLLITEEDGKTGLFDARLVKLGTTLLLDASPSRDDLQTEDVRQDLLLATHTFLHVEQIAPTLRMTALDPYWFKRFVSENPAAIGHEIVEHDVLLTAPTPVLQVFILKHLTDGAFDKDDPLELRRFARRPF